MVEINDNNNKIVYKKLLPGVYDKNGVKEFDELKIYLSLLNETTLNEQEAKKITELVVRRIISNNIAFLSAPHIREIVCSVLSEQHYEEDRKLYTRIGMPFYDLYLLLQKCEDELKELASQNCSRKQKMRVRKRLKRKLEKKIYRTVISELISVVKIINRSKIDI